VLAINDLFSLSVVLDFLRVRATTSEFRSPTKAQSCVYLLVAIRTETIVQFTLMDEPGFALELAAAVRSSDDGVVRFRGCSEVVSELHQQ